jgi:SAM-dependent MidA family methyltransferase
MTTSLPTPSADALQHSERVAALLRDEIAAEGGWLPFSRFMDLALYAPGLGYYSAGLHKFGSAGDFVTAPEISALFGRTLARQAAQILGATGGDILEVGAGSGRLALDLLLELEALGALPQRYLILEVSADLRQRQRQLLEEQVPQLAERVSWLDALPASFSGVILGNEALDAMPVELIAWRDGGIFRRGVVWENEAFCWRDQVIGEGDLYLRAAQLPPARFAIEYVSEVAPAVDGFIASLAACLEKGAMLFIDYGFGESEYYHPQRDSGTLMCHYRHHAHADPLILPGLQDITAHVDFSAVARSGAEAGLDLLGYTSQAHFLLNCGLTDLLGRVSPEDASAYLPLASQAQKLVSPAEMGELFKVIALGKGVGEPLLGFGRGDKRHSL